MSKLVKNPCFQFFKDGMCPNGKFCTHSHGSRPFRKGNDDYDGYEEWNFRKRNSRRKNRCFTFDSSGTCQFGKNCWYFHDPLVSIQHEGKKSCVTFRETGEECIYSCGLAPKDTYQEWHQDTSRQEWDQGTSRQEWDQGTYRRGWNQDASHQIDPRQEWVPEGSSQDEELYNAFINKVIEEVDRDMDEILEVIEANAAKKYVSTV